jgi:nitrite reductase/ring-hydroxylating ferredoxin subunit
MPEPDVRPQFLCPAEALVEAGDAVCFDVLDADGRVQAFALRFGGRVVAYLNRCAHVPAPMDWRPGRFLDHEQRHIICSMHGALYEPADGLCVSGPCPGARLTPLDVREADGLVHWYPDPRHQPLPSAD